MSEERAKPGGLLMATVVVAVLLMLYLLSAGPLIWLGHRGMLPTAAEPPLTFIYTPLIWVDEEGPSPFREIIHSYVELWKP